MQDIELRFEGGEMDRRMGESTPVSSQYDLEISEMLDCDSFLFRFSASTFSGGEMSPPVQNCLSATSDLSMLIARVKNEPVRSGLDLRY